ncbi:hypothetical protein VNI00_014846 [Paramarasmius palmivorus]|uniref:Secreted protein n=1 Tax=Paramarasmius palmivorus TaxID=297713 RepID=A0AAW0BQU3_9AGAR
MLLINLFFLGLLSISLGSPVESQEPLTLFGDPRTSTLGGADGPFGVGWVDPRIRGGRMLDFVTKKVGEPLNVIISGQSDPYILTKDGFLDYAKSLGFSHECLGLHYGQLHTANLGDGDGRKDEQLLLREYFFKNGAGWGTCWESLAGGNHFRAWKQNGTQANSGAWFLAASKEHPSSKNHLIIDDGYNIGRDTIVTAATAGTWWKGMWWKAELEWQEGLLEVGKEGVNHGIEQDGRVAILIVKRL